MSSNMKTYTEELKLTSEDIDIINHALTDKNFMGEDNTISFTVKFKDNKEADFKICGTKDDTAFLEVVLFENGCEVSCTEPFYKTSEKPTPLGVGWIAQKKIKNVCYYCKHTFFML